MLVVLPASCNSNEETTQENSTETTIPVEQTSTGTVPSDSEPDTGIIAAAARPEPEDLSDWPGNIHNDRSVWVDYAETDYYVVEKDNFRVWFDPDTGNPLLLENED